MPVKRKVKHTKRRKQRGKGFVGDAAKFVKDNKLISSGLGMIPHPLAQGAALIAKQFGLGNKSGIVSLNSQYGTGIFSDIGGGIGSVFGGIGGGLGSLAHGLFGGSAMRLKPGLIQPLVVSL